MCKSEMILLFSGGIDSYVAWHYLGKPQTVYFAADHRYMVKELKTIRSLIPTTIFDESLDLRDREVGDKAYIPFRNLLFALQASKYSDTIVIAGLKDDMVSDKNAEIFEEWSDMMSRMEGRPIKVMSPFFGMTKHQVVNWYANNVGPASDLTRCVSCYDPNNYVLYCGKCPACFRKWCALVNNGVELPFYNRELAEEYLKKAEEGFYDEERCKSILFAVKHNGRIE